MLNIVRFVMSRFESLS